MSFHNHVESLEPRCLLSVAPPPTIVFPDVPGDADGIINVTEFGVDLADNAHDDTPAIQNAIYQAFADGNRNRMVYLPAGTYNVDDTLYWKDANGNWQGFLKMVGEHRDTTIIKLRDNTFTTPPTYNPPPIQPNAVIYTAGGEAGPDSGWNPDRGTSNAMFSNCVWNLTIDIGSGNTGAVGIDYHVTNQGSIKDVKIISSDAQRRGYAGIRMTEGIVGPGMIKNVEITGFDYGIEFDGGSAHLTLEHIELDQQNIYGIKLAGQHLSMRDLTSTNSVPAIYMEYDGPGMAGSTLTLVDATLTGGSANNSAIMAQYRSVLYARNVFSQGYNVTVNNNAGTTVLPNGQDSPPGTGINAPAGYVAEYSTHNGMRMFDNSILATLNLPVQETPEFWSTNLADWANVKDYGAVPNDAGDDTAAIRAAIASGKPIVFFPQGGYNVSEPIDVGGAVRKLFGVNAVLDIHTSGPLIGATPAARLPMFRIVNAAHAQPIIFQSLRQDHFRNLTGVVNFEHASVNALAIVDTRFYNNADNHRYINTAAPASSGSLGDLFLEDNAFEGGNGFAFNLPQNIFIRNFDSEGQDGAVNNGANLWILGLKTEGRQTVITTINGGKTEVLGGVLSPAASAVNDDTVEAFIVRDAAMTLTTISNYLHSADDRYNILVEEERNGDRRHFRSDQAINQYHTRIPLYSGYTGSGAGLPATYYDNSNFTGTSISRTDPTVDFTWGSGSPHPSIGANTFSARWIGRVQAIETGNYVFRTQRNDGVRLWVNGNLVINRWTNSFTTVTDSSAAIPLIAGQKYDIKLEFYENTGSATVRLQWIRPGTSTAAVIPASQLYSAETMLLATSINDGAVQRSNTTTVALTFDDPANFDSLVSSGTIDDVIKIYDKANPAIALSWLTDAHFMWDADRLTLLIDLTADGPGGSGFTSLSNARYELRIDTAAIVNTAGAALLDDDGNADGLLTIDRSTGSVTQDLFRLAGDLNGDARVADDDLTPLARAYGTAQLEGDCNGDGIVNLNDLALLAAHHDMVLAEADEVTAAPVDTQVKTWSTLSETRNDPQRRFRSFPLFALGGADDAGAH